MAEGFRQETAKTWSELRHSLAAEWRECEDSREASEEVAAASRKEMEGLGQSQACGVEGSGESAPGGLGWAQESFSPLVGPCAASAAAPVLTPAERAGLALRAWRESSKWPFHAQWWCCHSQGLGVGKWEGGGSPT